MIDAIARPSRRFAALRVFGATGALFAALLGIVLLTRPDMVAAAMHAVMGLMP